jgi:hypothetical protein
MIKKDCMRFCATIPKCLNIKFSNNASRIFLFERGWKNNAIIEAIKMWMWVVNNDPELYHKLRDNIKQNNHMGDS